jgi:hypothetical protein
MIRALLVVPQVVNNPQANPLQPGRPFFMQYQTTYFHSSGQRRMRVVTVGRTWCDDKAPELGLSFDQECAAVVMARLATFKVLPLRTTPKNLKPCKTPENIFLLIYAQTFLLLLNHEQVTILRP